MTTPSGSSCGLERDPVDVRQNIEGGVRHLRHLVDRYGGDLAFALAAYNAGVEAVGRYGGIPPYAETQAYVARVLRLVQRVGPSRRTRSGVPEEPEGCGQGIPDREERRQV